MLEIMGNKIQAMEVDKSLQRDLKERKNLVLDMTFNRGHCNFSLKILADCDYSL